MADRPALTRSQRVILGLHVLAAVAFAVLGFLDTAAGDGWSDLARFAVLLLAGIYLLAVASVSAVGRYAMSNPVARILWFTLGPPALMVVAILAVRGG